MLLLFASHLLEFLLRPLFSQEILPREEKKEGRLAEEDAAAAAAVTTGLEQYQQQFPSGHEQWGVQQQQTWTADLLSNSSSTAEIHCGNFQQQHEYYGGGAGWNVEAVTAAAEAWQTIPEDRVSPSAEAAVIGVGDDAARKPLQALQQSLGMFSMASAVTPFGSFIKKIEEEENEFLQLSQAKLEREQAKMSSEELEALEPKRKYPCYFEGRCHIIINRVYLQCRIENVFCSRLFQDLHKELPLEGPSAHTHGREAVPLQLAPMRLEIL